MTVAWTKEAVGHASQDVIVRDPVVITAGLPRFLAPGDAAVMRLDVANTDGPDGDYSLAIETTGDLSTGSAALPDKLTLVGGKRQTLTVPLIAQTAGDASITIRLAHAGGLTVEQVKLLPVRPAAMPVTTRMVVDLGPNGSSLRVDRELLAASLLDGASVSVGVSQSAAFDVPSILMALDRYPYGCAEQTTSRALPLLYVSELAAGAGLDDEPELKERIQDAIYRVLNYQSSSGSFGLWGPGSGDLWLDAYVTDFLTRAREKGYDVPAQAMAQALEQSAELAGLRHRPARTAAPRSPMRSTCWRATRRRRSATSATIPTRSSRPSRARWRWRSSPRASRSTATRSARRRPSRPPSSLPSRPPTTTGTAPTTARSCATARRCWRSPPKAGRRRRWCRS